MSRLCACLCMRVCISFPVDRRRRFRCGRVSLDIDAADFGYALAEVEIEVACTA